VRYYKGISRAYTLCDIIFESSVVFGECQGCYTIYKVSKKLKEIVEMARICIVCKQNIKFLDAVLMMPMKDSPEREEIHRSCRDAFIKEYTSHDEESAKKAQLEVVKEHQEINDKSVHVISFDMPFEDMVMFMVKWAIASIPAFIILAIIGAIFFAFFGSLFFL
jgi:hypothetical protein